MLNQLIAKLEYITLQKLKETPTKQKKKVQHEYFEQMTGEGEENPKRNREKRKK